MIIVCAAVTLALVATLLLIPLGLRAGEQPGDACIHHVDVPGAGGGLSVAISNPGEIPVLVGLSLRPRTLRLRLAGGSAVRIRTRRVAADLMPGRQTVVGIVAGRQTGTFLVPAGAALGEHVELVVVIGQGDRLRSLHRAVRLAGRELAEPAVERDPSCVLTERTGQRAA